MGKTNLPLSWESVKLGVFVENEKGKKPKRQSPDKTEEFALPYVDIEAFEDGNIKSWTDGDGCRLCSESDFLMVWDGSRSGLVGKGMKGALGSTLVRINFPGMHNQYAYYFLLSKYQEINTRAKGSGTPHVDPDLLWNYSFPIAPLNEQKRIVAKIEELFSELDNGIATLKTAQEQLKVYRQAILKHAFEGKLTAKWREENADKLETPEQLLARIQKERDARYQQQMEEWKAAVSEWEAKGKEGKKPSKPKEFLPQGELSQLSKLKLDLPASWTPICIGHIYSVYVGATPNRKEDSYWNGDINWVSSGEVAFCEIRNTSEKITQLGYENTSTDIHPEGTVLLAMIGEGKTRGQAAILRIPAAHNQNTAAIRVSEVNHSSEYLYYFLQYQYEQTRHVGSGNNQKALNKQRVSNLIFPLCSTNEQFEISARIAEKFSVIENINQEISVALSNSKTLRQSILKKAFSGKLVPQDSNDEPASELLARIRAEKAQQKQPSKKIITKTSRNKVSKEAKIEN
ncbi:TPA: restriction endonuclease subunit S [Legionella pneumophila]|uniref:restriction endonuclease subunit S n=1 Tax=Legionella pneumophila TaxID=446 RepID=UPI0006942CCF|nr:restriction endonuclease subunit S [Legionella pneumophila]HAT8908010.1 type I restriction endonuclease subunit S [Legionella pneumophila subsp. pneumophila]MCW8466076.1 restriction endonuclease subunit S [Legionella pneumophila]MCW8475712.1 restriction endonuclease subunit S [Legionella pneumophila]HAT2030668.1 type I restriction endonuclease subunit S [Legionella pneumophila]HAU2317749.1 type I restriction endonuclease subunit S [Legionella pneumophila]